MINQTSADYSPTSVNAIFCSTSCASTSSGAVVAIDASMHAAGTSPFISHVSSENRPIFEPFLTLVAT
jgi:hypothetical protein